MLICCWINNTDMIKPEQAFGNEKRGVLAGLGWNSQVPGDCLSSGDQAQIPYIARDGDVIIVQERYDSVTHIVLEANGVLHNRYGRFLHSDVIGRALGFRWDAVGRPGGPQGRSCRGFVYALAPTPALWSLAMHHRTQVVYPHDSAIISLYLDLKPGSIVVESGTGAGSASIAFARVVAPHGRVLSFEFHKERAAAAASEFFALGLSSIIKVHAGHDVLREGFGPVPSNSVDAVFLDLPAPYHVIEEAARVLRPDGALCSFSPCIEQVQRTCTELRTGLFHSIRTFTAPVRTYETRANSRGSPRFDQVEVNRSRDGSTAQPDIMNHPEVDRVSHSLPDVDKSGAESDVNGETEKAHVAGRKRPRSGVHSAAGERSKMYAAQEAADKEVAGRIVHPAVPVRARPFADMKGHTSYLTFARRTRAGSKNGVVEVAETNVAGQSTSCKTM
jgi:tRNA (adenine57-N1/adenine58-N1)-methyltransferase catalytic subunit